MKEAVCLAFHIIIGKIPVDLIVVIKGFRKTAGRIDPAGQDLGNSPAPLRTGIPGLKDSADLIIIGTQLQSSSAGQYYNDVRGDAADSLQ